MKNGSIIITLLFIIVAIVFVSLFLMGQDANNVSQNAISEAGLDKTKIAYINNDGEWDKGKRYIVKYDNQLLHVSAFDNGEVSSIQDENRNIIYTNQNTTGIDSNNIDPNSIQLIYNELGQYGKKDMFDNEQYIRYYIPSGTYTVKSLTKNARFFIEKIERYKNSFGYDEVETVRTVQMGDINSTDVIEIKNDECIFLTIFSSIELKKND